MTITKSLILTRQLTVAILLFILYFSEKKVTKKLYKAQSENFHLYVEV